MRERASCPSRSRAPTTRRESPASSRTPRLATAAATCSPSGETFTAASVGVSARRSAARSVSVTSISWPTPATTGMRAAATARTSTSSLKLQRSSRLPPPRTSAITSGRGMSRSAMASAAASSSAAPAPCTRDGTTITSLACQRPRSVCKKSAIAAPVGLVTRAIRRGKGGMGRFRSAEKSPSASSRAWSRRSWASSVPVPSACNRSIVSW